jgi:hypothetical protein
MRQRAAVVLGVAALVAVAVPGVAGASARPSSSLPTCVVVSGPAGVHVQAGLAPHGPRGCRKLG